MYWKIYIENGVEKCVDSCPSGTYDNNHNKCVRPDECDFYDSTEADGAKKCYDSCKTRTGTANVYHNYGSKKCISGCTEGPYLYEYEEDKICYKKEDCKYVEALNRF